MANKKFLVGILVMVLVFGMSVVGCGGNRLEGTWQQGQWGDTITFGRNTVTIDGETGTFTTSRNNITMTLFGETLTGTFSIDGDILTITIDGQRETFTRRR